MIKRFNEFVNEGWAAGSMRRAVGGNLRRENSMPETKEELRDIIIKRINSEGPKCDLNDIDVSKIDDMSFLFCADTKASEKGNEIFKDFNGDISGWNVSGVNDMSAMFAGCTEFNCDISEWDVSGVKHMEWMFCGCEEFNQDIGGWNVSKVEDTHKMFYGCKKFNQNLSGWNISKYTESMTRMFAGCEKFTFAKKLEQWEKYKDMYYMMDVNCRIDMYYMFYGCPDKPEWYGKTKYGIQEIIYDRIKNEGPECDLNDIDISGISDMSQMFSVEYDNYNPVLKYFNGDISGWDVSGVEDMCCMFLYCEKFNGDIRGWNVSSVKDMNWMFRGCTGFHNAKNLKSWENKLRDDVKTEHMFDYCPVTPSWYKNKK